MIKTFESEELAQSFANKVNGKVKMVQLPDYMSVIIIYTVEYEEKE